MTPTDFPEANSTMHPPADMDESQCSTIPAYQGGVHGGNLDGSSVIIVAWQPTAADLEDLNSGNPVFLVCLGGLPPHTLTTRFPK